MANFGQFLTILERESTPRRMTYVCGDQGVLVEEVVDAVRATSPAEEMDRPTLFAGQDPTAKVWGEMNQHALDSSRKRLVTIRDAERLKGWDKFEDWMTSRHIPNIHVLMVAGEKEWSPKRLPQARERLLKSNSAIYVECTLPKGNPEKHAVEVIMGWGRMSRDVAAHLAKRTGYDLARCRDVCRWTNSMSGEITTRAIDAMAAHSPSESFVTSLLRMDKAAACTTAQDLERGDARRVINQLATKLWTVDRVNRAMQKALVKSDEQARAISDTATMADVSILEVKALWGVAKHYGPNNVRRRTMLLLRADQHRDQPGALEALAAEW